MKFTEDILNSIQKTRVAVIGNGSVKNENGSAIDAYDSVIRFNRFELVNYEKYIGSRVTHVCACKEKYTHWKFNEYIPVFCPYTRSLMGKSSRDLMSDRKIIHAKTPWYNQIPFSIKRPSSGSMLLFIFHQMKISVDVYGFDFLKTGHYFNEHHRHCPVHSEEYKMQEFFTNSDYIHFYE